jgi:hypothetical protein
MYYTRFDPFTRDFQRQFDRLARHAFGPASAPALDVVRHEGDVTLKLDVPGIDLEQLEVTVDRGILTISGKREEERTENDKFFVREPAAAAAGDPERRRGRGQLRQRRPRGPDPGHRAGEAAQDRGSQGRDRPGGRQAGDRRLTHVSGAH